MDLQTLVMKALRRRPQIPRKRNYHKSEVRIPVTGATVELAGELTTPDRSGPYPGIVLLTGSGQHTRDEHAAGHPWFLVLSDVLTRCGFAVLRCDDRGAGKSTGDFNQATLEDYANDGAAMLDFLRAQPQVDAEFCGFIGHSEGGMTAPLAATLTHADFIVTLAGPASPLLPDTLAQQYADILRAENKPEADVESAIRMVYAMTEILRSCTDSDEAAKQLTDFMKSESMSKREIAQNVSFWARPWGMHHARYDPRPALEAYSGPFLGVFGGRDLQVKAVLHAPEMEALLQNPRSSVRVFPDHNHLFQRSTTGRLMEYFSIRTTIDDEVTSAVVDWLQQLRT